ncbi:hypothetical protein ACFW04_012936 [Cataglyphis niger]
MDPNKIIEKYIVIEKNRINYCRDHQKELRTETYQDLRDYMQTMANNLEVLEKWLYFHLYLLDHRVICYKIIKIQWQLLVNLVKIFITMTCNPKLCEIEQNLSPGQQASYRPDICARVFNIQKFFEEVAAFVYVIEFQKCDLPHVHMLIILKYNFKITTPQIVNKYISAEIPDPYNGKNFERLRRYVVDNRNVVPYYPILSIIFNCHINVEVVSSIKSIKYLYKYIYRGHDVAVITIEPITENVIIDHDERHNYIETCYVRLVEAKAITSALNQVTMLIDYFSFNSRDEEARQYLYIEILCYYTFKKEKINGRNISPTQTELFHLRLLLLTAKAKSFTDLKFLNREVCQSFS